ncbi:MAG: hypothetical protein PHW03_09365 [Eubacteriales bacterium]|nr:hypothetical protein [Eubacteriales bacterium]MDD4390982.1 hypothetical protein [Eubacteriales bacterium]
MNMISFNVLYKRIKAISFMLRDPNVPKRKKLIIIAGIMYLFMPLDFLPIVVFPVSILDDILVWLLILWYLREELDKYWVGGKTQDLSRKFRSKTIIDDVNFEIKDDKKED